MQRDFPLSLQVLGELNWDGFEEDFKLLTDRITLDDQARAEWVAECGEIDQQLAGKDTRVNKPWPHAADLSIPLTKKLLRRWTPVLYNLVALADPISHFKTSKAEAAFKAPTAEAFFTWLVRDHMDGALKEIRYLINDIGSKGIGYLGVSWDYKTEPESRVVIVQNVWPQGPPTDVNQVVRDLVETYEIRRLGPEVLKHLTEVARLIIRGAQYVKIGFERVIADKPKITRHHPFDVVVPADSGSSEEADYVCLMHDFTASQLRTMAKNGILNPQAVEELIERTGEDNKGVREDTNRPRRGRFENTNGDEEHRSRQQDAGVQTTIGDKPIRIHQVFCLLDNNGDGISERCVLWYAPLGGENKRLALHDFPFSFRYWPVFRFDYEDVDRRPYLSRGAGHHLKDIQDQYNKQYRATSDAIDIQLAPTFQRRVTSKFVPRSFKWGPGAVMDVQRIGDIAPIEKSPFNLHQYLQDRGELKMFAEEMIGTVDSALAATGKNLERRTAFEVQQVAGQIEAIQGMDSAIFQSTMGKVFQCVWELWLDLGSEEVYFQVTGEQEPKPFRKSQYAYRYQLTPAGTPGNTNRSAELGRALQITQIVMQAFPDLINRPVLLQWIVKQIDYRMANAIVLPQAQQVVEQTLQGAAQMIAKGELPEAAQALIANPASGAGGGAT